MTPFSLTEYISIPHPDLVACAKDFLRCHRTVIVISEAVQTVCDGFAACCCAVWRCTCTRTGTHVACRRSRILLQISPCSTIELVCQLSGDLSLC